MGSEGRQRFPARTAGTATVTRGSARKKPQQRDRGETVTVSSPQVSAPRVIKPAGKKHSQTKDLTVK